MALRQVIGPGHYVLHVDEKAISVQMVDRDQIYERPGGPVLGSLLNLSLLCDQVPHI